MKINLGIAEVRMQEFNTYENCKRAKKILLSMREGIQKERLKAKCVPK